ncbi:helix-turn-helix domain-containing protein [Sinomicrobium oceani]|uniref:helix-turn-helix domain-containing protein n=1 Tax=Sinomicrobium oceani TaxID=1150368 RepID=UPI00227A2659|nr:helix-turn-helix transcriptional regulator [Sinomicrobium oceani]
MNPAFEHQEEEHFPVLDIQEFDSDRQEGCNLLYHELRGQQTIMQPHKHDFFVFMLFESGGGIHTIDFRDYEIVANQVHLLFPGQVHRWDMQPHTVGYQLMIGRAQLETLLPSLHLSYLHYRNHPVVDIPQDAVPRLLYEFHAIRTELNSTNPFRQLIDTRIRLLALMVGKIAEHIFGDVHSYRSNPVLSAFLSLTDRYFRAERSVSFYAEKLNITPNYLNIICKKTLGVSASSCIQDRSLLEAKRLLKTSDIYVKEIVYELGFYDHASFSRFFKQHTGLTPQQFREQH